MSVTPASAKSNNPYPVAPTGYLLGSYIALALYGVHTSQVVRYFTRHSDGWKTRALVGWIFTLSTIQILIIVGSGWRYFVAGINDPEIWGEFWWPLSFQDGLVPLMAYTAQMYFGRRAWALTGRRPWILWAVSILSTIGFLCGIALAVTARIWADDPYVSALSFQDRKIGVPSQVVAILWMGLSAFIDGSLTLILVYRFLQARNSSWASTRSLVRRMIALTLETVLLTHIVGATMCVIFLASPAAHRTQSDIFWVLLEIITELYALSIVFTITSRRPTAPSSPVSTTETDEDIKKGAVRPTIASTEGRELRQTVLDNHVEGYQGSTPFGVRIYAMNKIHHNHRNGQMDLSNDSTAGISSQVDSSEDGGGGTPITPGDEIEMEMYQYQVPFLNSSRSRSGIGESHLGYISSSARGGTSSFGTGTSTSSK